MKLFVSIHSPVFINTNTKNSISESDVPIFRYKHEEASLKMAPQKAFSTSQPNAGIF